LPGERSRSKYPRQPRVRGGTVAANQVIAEISGPSRVRTSIPYSRLSRSGGLGSRRRMLVGCWRGSVTIEPDPELATLVKVLRAYGTDLASFEASLEGRVKVTLNPVHAVALG